MSHDSPPPFERLDLAVPVIECRPETMGGRAVYRGTRVPVEVLFENLADGLSLTEILDSYPTLAREDCQAAILQACALLGMSSDSNPSTQRPQDYVRAHGLPNAVVDALIKDEKEE